MARLWPDGATSSASVSNRESKMGKTKTPAYAGVCSLVLIFVDFINEFLTNCHLPFKVTACGMIHA